MCKVNQSTYFEDSLLWLNKVSIFDLLTQLPLNRSIFIELWEEIIILAGLISRYSGPQTLSSDRGEKGLKVWPGSRFVSRVDRWVDMVNLGQLHALGRPSHTRLSRRKVILRLTRLLFQLMWTVYTAIDSTAEIIQL